MLTFMCELTAICMCRHPPNKVQFVPRVYGFKIHPSSAYYPAPAGQSPSKSKKNAAQLPVETVFSTNDAVSQPHIPNIQDDRAAVVNTNTILQHQLLTEEEQQMLKAMNQMNASSITPAGV